jgi:hypothetical protein
VWENQRSLFIILIVVQRKKQKEEKCKKTREFEGLLVEWVQLREGENFWRALLLAGFTSAVRKQRERDFCSLFFFLLSWPSENKKVMQRSFFWFSLLFFWFKTLWTSVKKQRRKEKTREKEEEGDAWRTKGMHYFFYRNKNR